MLRRGLFGFRRGDVVGALDEQRRQIEALSAAVESLLRERGQTWVGGDEHAAAARLDEISAKLDRLLAGRDGTQEPREAEQRHVYVSELGDLGEFRARRVARRAGP
ncbi:MAG: hypothetical protein QOG29_1527 [Gaiellaceae bacterium]|nr:hypothetical protein [Gaiellaceae bacterium]MDX6488107.1 hypothetical protein [Gaiellaceae bacterium]MDX6509301.1 hypothetical protein [Gaiellaceae bacterium]MDX6543212.1 hypothetical protein [Gaiellaceae bacterium]